MVLSAGARLGPYEIVGLIGAGGMGEVYRARDPRLGREVAVKVLPAAFSLDSDRQRRFDREARAAAALNHPNILAVYDVGTDADRTYVVSELLRGETLRSRLSGGPLPLRKTLEYAIQIAHGLAAAHDTGIAHRDLKPENLFVTADGHVKILDFGLAKPNAASLAGDARSQTPTATFETDAGVVLGTIGYMAPEQVTEQPADHRADIFALGAICYEMLTGTRAFGRPSAAETMTAILREDPRDLSSLRSDVPPALQQIIRRCLEKRPAERFQSTRDLAFALEAVAQGSGPNPTPVVTATASPRRRRAFVAACILILTAVAAALGTWVVTRPAPTPPPPVTRFAITLPAAQAPTSRFEARDVAISSDGTHLVYTAGAQAQLMVRALHQLDAVALRGITNASSPFFSPDGRSIGFFDRGVLKKVSIAGGPPIALCRVSGTSLGASWGPDDTIVFATSDTSSGLLRVAASGGEPDVLTTADPAKGEQDHVHPSVLPGGRGLLFTIVTGVPASSNSHVAILDLKTGRHRTLIPRGRQAEYVESGHLVYVAAGTLWAVRFDLAQLQLQGDPVPVVDALVRLNYAVSDQGALVYVPGGDVTGSLVWVNRQGNEEPIAVQPRVYLYPRLSPDGSRVAVRITDSEFHIWTGDLARHTFGRLTLEPGETTYPVWTRDGSRIVFTSTRSGAPNLYRRLADGTGPDEQLTSSSRQQNATAISADGIRLVYHELIDGTYDLMLLSLDGTPRTEPLLQTPSNERNAEISPDGHWLAYESDESGQFQIYVRPFPNVSDGPRHQISSGGGRTPVWAPNGRELFFVSGTSLLSVAVQLTPTFSAGTPTKLFDSPSILFDAISGSGRNYDVSRDGQRFVMIKDNSTSVDGQVTPGSMVVVQNWFEELKAKVPATK